MKRSYRLITFVFLLFIFSSFLFPGNRVANDYPLISADSGIEGFSPPSLWSERSAEGMGEYVISTLWSWPMDFLYGLLFKLGFNFSLVERLLGVTPILILGYVGISRLLSHFKIKGYGRVVGTLLYLTNTYIILLVDGGQFSIGIAYAFFPISFISVIKAIRSTLLRKIIAGLSVCVLGVFDIRFIYILLILLFIYFIYESIFLKKDEVKRWIRSSFLTGFITLLIFTGLNFYWLLPALLVKAPVLPSTYQRVTQTSFLSFTTLGHALYLLQPHWYLNVFGKVTPLVAGFAFIPMLVFLTPVLKKKDRNVGLWLIVAVIGIFLTKGVNAPLGTVYNWLFVNIPGFSLFRDSTKFFFLVALAYSVLIGYTVEELNQKIKWKMEDGRWKIVIPIILCLYLMIIIKPIWTGKMTGTFSPPINKEDFTKVSEVLKKDTDFGRVLWIPSRPPLGHLSPIHPILEASRIAAKRPFSSANVGIYESFNFIRVASYMGELFDIAGIKYIGYPYPDTRREDLKPDNIDYYYSFVEQLQNLGWIDDISLYHPPVALFKTKHSEDRFFTAENKFLVVGSEGIYNELLNIQNFGLQNNALIFAEEGPGLGNTCKNGSQQVKTPSEPETCKVLLYDKDKIDFAVTLIDRSAFIFPSGYLDFDPDESGWWKRETADFARFRYFLQEKYSIDSLDFDYGGGYAIAEGNKKIQIANNILKNGEILLARVMQSSRGGKIEFYQSENKIGEIITNIENPEKINIKLTGNSKSSGKYFTYDKSDIRWFEVGELKSDDDLEIRTEGSINIINALVVTPLENWTTINASMYQYNIIDRHELIDGQKSYFLASDSNPDVGYERISPARYKVNINGLKNPETLVFSETYDPLWEIKNIEDGVISNSYPLYSLINGFNIDHDGVYEVYFPPQKYTYPGLLVSGLTLVISISGLILLKKKQS